MADRDGGSCPHLPTDLFGRFREGVKRVHTILLFSAWERSSRMETARSAEPVAAPSATAPTVRDARPGASGVATPRTHRPDAHTDAHTEGLCPSSEDTRTSPCWSYGCPRTVQARTQKPLTEVGTLTAVSQSLAERPPSGPGSCPSGPARVPAPPRPHGRGRARGHREGHARPRRRHRRRRRLRGRGRRPPDPGRERRPPVSHTRKEHTVDSDPRASVPSTKDGTSTSGRFLWKRRVLDAVAVAVVEGFGGETG